MPPSLTFRGLTACAALLAAAAAEGTRGQTPPPPPLAESQAVEVFRGGAIRIVLKAAGRSANEARFLIRTPPEAGTLTEPRPARAGRATVKYQHDPASNATSDEFTFAVQSSDSPVSAAGKVRIRIVERPPDFQAPASVDMGRVFVDRDTPVELEISNAGGGTVSGSMSVSEPWKIVGGSSYRLAAGESATVELIFHPDQERSFTGRLGFDHDPAEGVTLTAVAVAPFTASPQQLELRHPDGRTTPSSITLRNATPEPVTLGVSGAPGVIVPERILIPAESEETLTVSADPSLRGASSGMIQITANTYETRVPFQVFALPPQLSIEPENGLDLGRIPADSAVEARIAITNTGGAAADVTVTGTGGIHIPRSAHFSIPGGSTRDLRFSVEPSESGNFEGRLELRYSGNRVAVPVRARVEPRRPSDWTPAPEEVQAIEEPEPFRDPANLNPDALPLLFDRLLILSRTPNSVRIAWRNQGLPAERFQVERRILSAAPQGGALIEWEPLQNVFLNHADEQIVADIAGLRPNARHTIRVVLLDTDGKPVGASGTFPIRALAPPPGPRVPWVWIAAGTAVLGTGVWLIRRKRRRREDA